MSENALANSIEYSSFEMDSTSHDTKRNPQLAELMVAILFTAVQDLEGKLEDRKRALKYLHSVDEEYLFSFHSICSYLGYDPESTRWKMINGRRGKIRRRVD